MKTEEEKDMEFCEQFWGESRSQSEVWNEARSLEVRWGAELATIVFLKEMEELNKDEEYR